MFVTFRPEYLGDDHEEFTWLEHRITDRKLDLMSGDIEKCPFFGQDSDTQLFVPNGWVRGIKKLMLDGIVGFTADGHAILSNGDTAVYQLPYPSKALAVAA